MPISTVQTVYDSLREARLRISTRFIAGDTDEQNVIKVQPSTLLGALNVSGHILAGNANPRPFYNTTIKQITWTSSASAGKSLALLWQTSNGTVYANTLVTHLSGTGSYPSSRGPEITFSTYGQNASNLMISTYGFSANDSYSIEIELIKSPQQYDWGELSNPQEFNFPPRKVYIP